MTQATVQNAQQKINDLISENAALRERVKRDRLYFEKISLLATPPPNLPSASDEILDFAAPALNEIYETAQAALKEGE